MTTETLRSSAVSLFDREWAAAADAGLELGRVFTRLASSMRTLYESGAHMHIVFDDKLTQAAWVAYQEMHGELVPRSVEEAPIPAYSDG